MLLGEYTHTLDPKKRLSLPSKFRKEMGKTVVLTKGLDMCLFLYSVKEWEKVAGKLSGSSTGQSDMRAFNRFLLAGAVELDVDSLGRILVPDFLKDFAELKSKVIITGVHDRAEIWDEVRWGEYKKKIAEQADALAQKLGELGVF